jgi:hypothetical protein
MKLHIGFSLFSRAASCLSFCFASALLIGCSPPPNSASKSKVTESPPDQRAGTSSAQQSRSKHFLKEVPTSIRGASRSIGGICPVDSINLQLVANLSKPIRVARDKPFAAEGWAATADPSNPVPSLVLLFFSANDVEYSLEGDRIARPDVARSDPKLQYAGYRAAGYLSEVPAGTYRLKFGTGDSKVLVVCDTKLDILLD